MLDENYYIKFFEQTWAHVKLPYLKPIQAETFDLGDGETLTLTPWDPGFFKQICYLYFSFQEGCILGFPVFNQFSQINCTQNFSGA